MWLWRLEDEDMVLNTTRKNKRLPQRERLKVNITWPQDRSCCGHGNDMSEAPLVWDPIESTGQTFAHQ